MMATVPADSKETSSLLPPVTSRSTMGRELGINRALPTFSLAKYSESLVQGIEEQVRRKAEQAACWTTPGLPPLASPPPVNWKWFTRTYLKSEFQNQALFPHDAAKRAAYQDLVGEVSGLKEYLDWTREMASNVDTDSMRRYFYRDLAEELEEDWKEVLGEARHLWLETRELPRFEYKYLTAKGGTEHIEECLRKRLDIFRTYGLDPMKKYGYLLPPDFKVDSVLSFEHEWLDPAGGTSVLEYELEHGGTVFACWPEEEVMDKYGHLIPDDYQLKMFVHKCEQRYGGISNLGNVLRDGIDVFRFENEDSELLKAYGHLIPPDFTPNDLLSFEAEWFSITNAPDMLKHRLEEGTNVFHAWPQEEIIAKYGHLIPTDMELRRFNASYINRYGSTAWIERYLEQGIDIFLYWDPEVKEAWKHLIPPGFKTQWLRTFEHHWLDKDGENLTIQILLMNGYDILEGWWFDKGIRRKYSGIRESRLKAKESTSESRRQGPGTKQAENVPTTENVLSLFGCEAIEQYWALLPEGLRKPPRFHSPKSISHMSKLCSDPPKEKESPAND